MRVALIFGGTSPERDVSISSAIDVAASLERSGHHVQVWHIDRDGGWSRAPSPPLSISNSLSSDRFFTLEAISREFLLGSPDVIFPLLHGWLGEDGRIQVLCEWLGVPYVGSGHIASGICLNKVLCKSIVQASGVAVTRHCAYSASEAQYRKGWSERIAREVGFPCVVKPIDGGSSIGLSLANDSASCEHAIESALAVTTTGVLIEEYIESVDVEVPLIGHNTLRCGYPSLMNYEGEIYDYHAKYEIPLRRLTPAPLGDRIIDQTRQIAERVFRLLGLSGIARVDFLVTPSNEVFLNEVNTIPFLAEASLFAESLGQSHRMDYDAIIAELINAALERSAEWKAVYGNGHCFYTEVRSGCSEERQS